MSNVGVSRSAVVTRRRPGGGVDVRFWGDEHDTTINYSPVAKVGDLVQVAQLGVNQQTVTSAASSDTVVLTETETSGGDDAVWEVGLPAADYEFHFRIAVTAANAATDLYVSFAGIHADLVDDALEVSADDPSTYVFVLKGFSQSLVDRINRELTEQSLIYSVRFLFTFTDGDDITAEIPVTIPVRRPRPDPE